MEYRIGQNVEIVDKEMDWNKGHAEPTGAWKRGRITRIEESEAIGEVMIYGDLEGGGEFFIPASRAGDEIRVVDTEQVKFRPSGRGENVMVGLLLDSLDKFQDDREAGEWARKQFAASGADLMDLADAVRSVGVGGEYVDGLGIRLSVRA